MLSSLLLYDLVFKVGVACFLLCSSKWHLVCMNHYRLKSLSYLVICSQEGGDGREVDWGGREAD